MLVEKAAALLKSAKYVVALTGAGISTPSGIPDFRSSVTGLWNKVDPLEVASLNTFRVHPETFFKWFRPFTQQILEAHPNPAHLALAQLESENIVHSVITQNIDGLHQKAGTHHVLEVHGTVNTVTCGSCYTKFSSTECIKSFEKRGLIPVCPKCGGTLKPDAILFGEQLPQIIWQRVLTEIHQSDLMLVVGSSLEVFPVAKLPYNIVSNGGKLIIINNQETYLDKRADVVFHQDAAIVLPQIMKVLNNG
ncbi:NAD-dependent deacylase [bacterium]|nr:NAD-dependent deacylase [bacterium]